jgi:hypothetical protein
LSCIIDGQMELARDRFDWNVNFLWHEKEHEHTEPRSPDCRPAGVNDHTVRHRYKWSQNNTLVMPSRSISGVTSAPVREGLSTATLH